MNYCCKLLFVKEMLIESKKENESNKIVKHIMEWEIRKESQIGFMFVHYYLGQCSNSWALVLKSGNWEKLLTLNLSNFVDMVKVGVKLMKVI